MILQRSDRRKQADREAPFTDTEILKEWACTTTRRHKFCTMRLDEAVDLAIRKRIHYWFLWATSRRAVTLNLLVSYS